MTKNGNIINIPKSEVIKDIDCILWSTKLSELYRYTNQRFWEIETKEHEYAMRIEGRDRKGKKTPRLESVAEHSWHIADIVLILVHRFPKLNIERCLSLAILHDKLEIITDDKNPLGRDGKGTKTHAFNLDKRVEKDKLELRALNDYKMRLNIYAKRYQSEIILDAIHHTSPESKFIKAIDKLHPIIFILRKKKGNVLDEHMRFTLRYSSSSIDYFPEIRPYYEELVSRLIKLVASEKGEKVSKIEEKFLAQLQLF